MKGNAPLKDDKAFLKLQEQSQVNKPKQWRVTPSLGRDRNECGNQNTFSF